MYSYILFTGSIQKHDALCVLALNILNEKIYIFLWFWFIFLSVMSGLALLYSTVIVVLPSIRETILKRRFRFGTPAGVSAVVDKTQVSIYTDIALSQSTGCEFQFRCAQLSALYTQYRKFCVHRNVYFYKYNHLVPINAITASNGLMS
jgi:hypothetical protein